MRAVINGDPATCDCVSCVDERFRVAALTSPTAQAARVEAADRTAPTRVNDLEVALRSLVLVLKRRDGYMTSEEQYALVRAEGLLGMR